MNAQRLENPGRRVDALRRPPPGNAAAHQLGQLRRGDDRLARTGPDDLAGDPSGPALFSVFPKNPHEFLRVCCSDHLGSRLPCRRVHAHVQGAVLAKGEAALRTVQLMRRDTQIQQDAIDQVDAEGIEMMVEPGKVPLPEQGAITERRENGTGGGERGGIVVKADDEAIRG